MGVQGSNSPAVHTSSAASPHLDGAEPSTGGSSSQKVTWRTRLCEFLGIRDTRRAEAQSSQSFPRVPLSDGKGVKAYGPQALSRQDDPGLASGRDSKSADRASQKPGVSNQPPEAGPSERASDRNVVQAFRDWAVNNPKSPIKQQVLWQEKVDHLDSFKGAWVLSKSEARAILKSAIAFSTEGEANKTLSHLLQKNEGQGYVWTRSLLAELRGVRHDVEMTVNGALRQYTSSGSASKESKAGAGGTVSKPTKAEVPASLKASSTPDGVEWRRREPDRPASFQDLWEKRDTFPLTVQAMRHEAVASLTGENFEFLDFVAKFKGIRAGGEISQDDAMRFVQLVEKELNVASGDKPALDALLSALRDGPFPIRMTEDLRSKLLACGSAEKSVYATLDDSYRKYIPDQ